MGNLNTLNNIKDKNKKFAAHVFDRNKLVEMFAMSELGGIDILEQPVCPRCEKIMLFSDHGATCLADGTQVPQNKIVTLRQYLSLEFKKLFSDDQISDIVEVLEELYKEGEKNGTINLQ
jgi:hypothetical protein